MDWPYRRDREGVLRYRVDTQADTPWYCRMRGHIIMEKNITNTARVDFVEAAWRLGFAGSALELAAHLGRTAPDSVVATRQGLRVDLSLLAGGEAAFSLPQVTVVESGRL